MLDQTAWHLLVLRYALSNTMNEWFVVALVFIYFVAGAIKGTFGIGFPTAAIALSATVSDARSAIAYVVIPMCLINAWQIYRSGHLLEVLMRNWPLVTSMVSTIAVFSLFSADIPIRWLTLLLGFVTVSFALLSLWRQPPELPVRFDRLAQFCAGAVSGVIGGLAGIWAPPIIIYLTSRIVNSENALASTLLLLPAIAGFSLGELLRKHIPAERFQKLVLVVFLLLGLNFIRRSFTM